MILIGLSGAAGSGKNFVADQITAKYESVKQLAFGDPLKQVVHHMFGVPLEDCYTEAGKARLTWQQWEDCDVGPLSGTLPTGKCGPMTVRDLLQYVGTDLVRDCWNRDHWIRLAEQRIRNSPEAIVLVTDVRFENEANLITGMGGTVLRVVGRKASNTPTHASETGQFYVAGMVDNSEGRTARQLVEQVEAFVHGLDREVTR